MAILQGNLQSSQGAVAVVMAGGSGTRFWPLSRASRPKQYLSLSGSGRSLIEDTVARLEPVVGRSGIFIVTGQSQCAELSKAVPEICYCAEPVARNTAPCLALAAQLVLNELGDVPMIAVSADHVILSQERVQALFQQALEYVRHNDVLLTFGVTPTSPETGYGYIRAGAALDGGLRLVERFVEKPDRKTAEGYVASGNFYWNSGMFAWRPSVVLEAFSHFLPGVYESIAQACSAADGTAALAEVFANISPISIDVGVMEKAENVVVLPAANIGWSDVGSWASWADVMRHRQGVAVQGNFAHGAAVFVDSKGCSTYSEKRLIASVGLQDVIVVETEDAILVCHKEASQQVRDVIDELRRRGDEQLV